MQQLIIDDILLQLIKLQHIAMGFQWALNFPQAQSFLKSNTTAKHAHMT
jgi:hypothetical protein